MLIPSICIDLLRKRYGNSIWKYGSLNTSTIKDIKQKHREIYHGNGLSYKCILVNFLPEELSKNLEHFIINLLLYLKVLFEIIIILVTYKNNESLEMSVIIME